MSDMDDDLTFASETPEDEAAPQTSCSLTASMQPNTWKLLMVDDEPAVHDITRMALEEVRIDGSPLEFHSVYSGKDACEFMAENNDVAMILLDVVMESDDAGLKTVQHIRDTLKNQTVRIVLRTGQPGIAPERQVIADYDINDYVNKTDLSSIRLYTTVCSAVRAYRDLLRLDVHRIGLERIIDASASVFKLRSLEQFFGGMIANMVSIFGSGADAFLAHIPPRAGAAFELDRLRVIAGAEDFRAPDRSLKVEQFGPAVQRVVAEAVATRSSAFAGEHHCIFMRTERADLVFYFRAEEQMPEFDRQLLDLFCNNIPVAVDNISLHDELEQLNASLNRFVPNRSIELLGKHRVTDVDVGENARRDMTVLFLDIRGFTGICEAMGPEEAFALINSFLGKVGPVVGRHGGLIDKYLGDGLMALFCQDSGNAEHAVACSMEMLETVAAYNMERQALCERISLAMPPVPPLKVGVGIHSGPAILGTVGFEDRVDFTVLGDVVNTAARIQHLTRYYGSQILMHQTTEDRLPPSYKRRCIGSILIRGKRDPMRIWEYLDTDPEEQQALKSETAALLLDALDAMDHDKYDVAHTKLLEVLRRNPADGAARYHLEHLGHLPPHMLDRHDDVFGD